MLRMRSVKRCSHTSQSDSHARTLTPCDFAAMMLEQRLNVLPRNVCADRVSEDGSESLIRSSHECENDTM